jgi:hypothetical protein
MTDTTNPQADRRQTVEYFLQTRQPDDTWEGSSSFMTDPDEAQRRLAIRLDKMPQFEHRLTRRTTTVVVEPASAVPVPAPAPTDGSVREQLLDALDFAYCQGLGYATPEELVAAYDATLLPAPTDQTALRDRIAAAIDGVFTRWQTGLGNQRPQDAIHDAVMAVLPTPTDRGALVDLVDQLIEHCPDHGCVEPEWGDGCHCEIVPLLRRLADAVPVSGPGGAADETQATCDGCGHAVHPARQCPVVLYGERCACDEPVGETQQPARPRCPHCQMPHDLTPDVAAVCASIRASIAAHEAQQPETQALRMPRCPRCIHDERTRAVLQQSAMELYPPDHDPNCPQAELPAAVAQPDGSPS